MSRGLISNLHNLNLLKRGVLRNKGSRSSLEDVEKKKAFMIVTVYAQVQKEQGRIHNSISRVRWAGAIMEVRSPFG